MTEKAAHQPAVISATKIFIKKTRLGCLLRIVLIKTKLRTTYKTMKYEILVWREQSGYTVLTTDSVGVDTGCGDTSEKRGNIT